MNKENFKKNLIYLFDNINLKNGIYLNDVCWDRTNKKKFSSIHSISSYLAMFSPSLPSYFIDKYSKENDTIMDNFSGRGTTALVSREKKRKFIGNDLNPYAYVLSKLKVDKLNKIDLLNKINKLEIEYNKSVFINKKINSKNSIFVRLFRVRLYKKCAAEEKE
ncbi:MAG: site-specific DNA-methyltransferase, partial [Malacoplasma sp.]|nr:site-specific DNA-methyltransferase [Malacoplasma sp.]